MAILTAVEVPTLVGFRSISFEPVRKQQITPMAMGAVQTIDRATAMWGAEYATPSLMGDTLNEAIAWIDSLEGAMFPFLGYDPRRVMPYAYRTQPVAADPWTQSGQTAPRVTSASFANSTLTLGRLANGAIITKGDYISYFDGTNWWLFRSQQTVIAAGNAATVKVTPRPRTLVGTPDVRYRKACCMMKIIGGYTAQGDVDNPTSLSFKAYQFINRTS